MATQGYAIINVGGDKVEASATGLANSTNGFGSNQVINVGGNKAGGDPTGLLNDATVYTATWEYIDGTAGGDINIIGEEAQDFDSLNINIVQAIGAGGGNAGHGMSGGNINISSFEMSYGKSIVLTDGNLFTSITGFVAVGELEPGQDSFTPQYGYLRGGFHDNFGENEVETFGDLIARLDAGIFDAGSSVALEDGNIKFIQGGYGSASVVNLQDVNLPGYQRIMFGGDPAPTDPTGLDSGTTYEFTVYIRGIEHHVELLGSDAPTFADLYDEVNAILAPNGLLEPSPADALRIVDAVAGAESRVRIAYDAHKPNTLFPALTGFLSYSQPVGGEGPIFSSLDGYVGIDEVPGTQNLQYYQIVNVGGNKTQGTGPTGLLQSKVFSHGYHRCNFTAPKNMNSATGLENDTTEYTCTINIRGITHPITVLGQDAQDFTSLMIAIRDQIPVIDGHSWSMNTDHIIQDGSFQQGDLFVFTYDTNPAVVGVGSACEVEDDDLFMHLTDFDGFDSPVGGVDNGYSAVINVDGVPYTVKLNGGSQSSVLAMNNCRLFYFLILGNFNQQLAPVASTMTKLEIFQGNLRLISEVPISIDDDGGPGSPLFSSLTGFTSIGPVSQFGVSSVNNMAIARSIAESISESISE